MILMLNNILEETHFDTCTPTRTSFYTTELHNQFSNSNQFNILSNRQFSEKIFAIARTKCEISTV